MGPVQHQRIDQRGGQRGVQRGGQPRVQRGVVFNVMVNAVFNVVFTVSNVSTYPVSVHGRCCLNKYNLWHAFWHAFSPPKIAPK